MTGWKHGALHKDSLTSFRVWAPLAKQVQLVLEEPEPRKLEMKGDEFGYFELELPDCGPGTRYMYQLDDGDYRPDPASRWQPDGVHSASAVVEQSFQWNDEKWSGIPLEEYVIYEMHVGTFTQEGTFDAAIAELQRLKALGITAVEVMPIAQFPGDRNWGYDGVYLYAAQHSYGGLRGFKRFVNAAHQLDMAVVLDVVYNHFGPEGNYLSQFGPYFNDDYRTPWGASLNYDGPYSDGVREFLIGNAIFWMDDCHVDALRLDAVHAIIDTSAFPFLQQLTGCIHGLGRKLHKRLHVIGENDNNDPQFTVSPDLGGLGADSQWSDDFHHALHTVLTGNQHGYYKDFGSIAQLAKAFTDGFVYDGCYSCHRRRHHGADSRHLDGVRFVVCSQNHDQIGNRPHGERLSMELGLERVKLAAIATLCSPYIPLLFMGEETAALSPFQYFVSHGDDNLIEAVRQGRKREFNEFFAHGEPPDPQSEKTFEDSKLRPDTTERGVAVTKLYQDLLALRKTEDALKPLNKRQTSAIANDLRQTLVLLRGWESRSIVILFNFSTEPRQIVTAAAKGDWKVLLDSEDPVYQGSGLQLPGNVSCDGELAIDLQGSSAVILQYQDEQTCINPSPSG